MLISLTPNIFSNTTNAADITFDELHMFFLKKFEYDGPKEGNIMFVMGELNSSVPEDGSINRRDDNVLTMSALIFDIDNKSETSVVTDPFKFASDLGQKCILASSASSTKDFPRARIVVPSFRPVTQREYQRIQAELHNAFKRDNPSLDRRMTVPSQAYYFPQQPTDKVQGYGFLRVFDGPLFDPDEYLKRLPIERVETVSSRRVREYAPLSLDQAIEALRYFDAGDDKDRFMTCLVFAKNWPEARSLWEDWHVSGSTKWANRKDIWSTQAKRVDQASYRKIDIGWFVKEAKKRSWLPSKP
jgi:hypothetical protein